jgi:hypothetical protein
MEVKVTFLDGSPNTQVIKGIKKIVISEDVLYLEEQNEADDMFVFGLRALKNVEIVGE